MSSLSPSSAWLIPLPGEFPLDPLELTAPEKNRPLVIGRNADCDLALPTTAEKVSRRHAQFIYKDEKWLIADLASRWGTSLNGVKLAPHLAVTLGEGDLLRIQPWTFRFSKDRHSTIGSVAADDKATTIVRTLASQPPQPLRQDMLSLLLEGAALIQSAADESQLATVLLDLARRGTGLDNATLLRALDANGRVDDFLAGDQTPQQRKHPAQYSRSLLTAASTGAVAEFSSSTSPTDVSQSIIQSNVAAAICAPLMLDTTVAAYLYLDSRGPTGQAVKQLRPSAAAFCQALCRIGGLALANLKRIDIQRRAAHMEAELTAAAAAQRWILPRHPISAAPFTCIGQSRTGGYLGGDFFDAHVLPDGRLAVCLGDVSGHGAAASVLMTAAQGFLHAALSAHGDLTRAVNSLNAFIQPRCSSHTFVTLWTAIFDPRQMSVEYIDAGHGYASLLAPGKSATPLTENGGLPIGIDATFNYQSATAKLSPGEQVLILSDGIIEQFAAEASPDGRRPQFGRHGVDAAISGARGETLIKKLFESLDHFAGGKGYSDDLTAVLVNWNGHHSAAS